MPRPKRPGGTFSREWPMKLNTFFNQHKRLTRKGVALVLSDIAYEQGCKPISVHALYKFCSTSASRRPTDHFIECWQVFEDRLRQLQDNALAIRTSSGRHFVTVIDGQIETVWLPNDVFLKRCHGCRVLFIGQWNAKRCPDCRPSSNLARFSKNPVKPTSNHSSVSNTLKPEFA